MNLRKTYVDFSEQNGQKTEWSINMMDTDQIELIHEALSLLNRQQNRQVQLAARRHESDGTLMNQEDLRQENVKQYDIELLLMMINKELSTNA